MNKLSITAEQNVQIRREVFTQTFERYWHPTGYNFLPAAVEKIESIAYYWMRELHDCEGNDGTYRKRLSKSIVLKPIEADILKNVFKKVFDVDLELTEQRSLGRWLENCIFGCSHRKKQAVRILPKNLAGGYEKQPLSKYYVRASWHPDNPHVKGYTPLPGPSADELLAEERKHSRVEQDVLLKVGDVYLKTHSYLLATHSTEFYQMIPKNSAKQIIALEDASVEAMKVILHWIYTGTLYYDESSNIDDIRDAAKTAEKYGFTSCHKACQALLSKMT